MQLSRFWTPFRLLFCWHVSLQACTDHSKVLASKKARGTENSNRYFRKKKKKKKEKKKTYYNAA
jgi:hypothetical protein